jgi:hypothetical protein
VIRLEIGRVEVYAWFMQSSSLSFVTPGAPSVPEQIASPHTSPNDRLGAFTLDQLEARERTLAKAHIETLSAALRTGSREAICAWLAQRAAEEDAVGRLYGARREAAQAQNHVSKALFMTLGRYDALATAAHRRCLDLIEVLQRLQRPTTTSVRIASADRVAVVVGGSEGR